MAGGVGRVEAAAEPAADIADTADPAASRLHFSFYFFKYIYYTLVPNRRNIWIRDVFLAPAHFVPEATTCRIQHKEVQLLFNSWLAFFFFRPLRMTEWCNYMLYITYTFASVRTSAVYLSHTRLTPQLSTHFEEVGDNLFGVKFALGSAAY